MTACSIDSVVSRRLGRSRGACSGRGPIRHLHADRAAAESIGDETGQDGPRPEVRTNQVDLHRHAVRGEASRGSTSSTRSEASGPAARSDCPHAQVVGRRGHIVEVEIRRASRSTAAAATSNPPRIHSIARRGADRHPLERRLIRASGASIGGNDCMASCRCRASSRAMRQMGQASQWAATCSARAGKAGRRAGRHRHIPGHGRQD